MNEHQLTKVMFQKPIKILFYKHFHNDQKEWSSHFGKEKF